MTDLFQTSTEYPNDRYTYIRKIVDGSNSKLYIAYDTHIKKYVVIKRLLRSSGWYKELNILKLLKDIPNILICTDHYVSWRYAYIVTEHSGNFNVEDYAELNAPYEESVAKKIFVKMLRCVKSIHDKNISHLDIKCENFVMTNPNKLDIMLIDFGHAEIIDHNTDNYMCRYGTSLYLCPEGNDYHYGFPSDIWSLGICYYQLLTGEYPFDDSYSTRKYKKNVLDNKLNISDKISSKAKAIIKMMLFPDPKYRPSIDTLLESSYFE